MKNYIDRFSSEELRTLCIRQNWFNSGSCEQYDRLFDMLDNGASTEDLATVIWLCSTDEAGSPIPRKDILATLEAEQAWPIYIDHLADVLREELFGETEVEIIREALRTHPDAGRAFRLIETTN